MEHFVQDTRLLLDECRRMNLDLPGPAFAGSLDARLMEQGRGRLGMQALVLALAPQSRLEWPPALPPQPA